MNAMSSLDLTSRALIYAILCLMVCGCSDPIIGASVAPDWWNDNDLASAPPMITKDDVLNAWAEHKPNPSLSDIDDVRNARIFFKWGINSIESNSITPEAKILLLTVMNNDRIESSLRRELYIYQINEYLKHDQACEGCNITNSQAHAVMELARILAFADGNTSLAIKYIKTFMRTYGYTVSTSLHISLYKLAADIYLKRGMGTSDREFMKNGFISIQDRLQNQPSAEFDSFMMSYQALHKICC